MDMEEVSWRIENAQGNVLLNATGDMIEFTTVTHPGWIVVHCGIKMSNGLVRQYTKIIDPAHAPDVLPF